MNRRDFLATAALFALQRTPGAAIRVGVLKSDGSYAVTSLPMERYVSRVLAGEAARESRPAALEALAIAIRTYALANLGRHRADGFDMCDQTHCQVLRTATGATDRAAEATVERVLRLRSGAPAPVFYTASCGGRSEVPSQVWPAADDPPFLPSHKDEACQGAPFWTSRLPAVDLLRAFQAAGYKGDRLKKLKVAERNGSGRVARLSLDGLAPKEMSGQDLRVVLGRTLGWQHIKSTIFEVREKDDVYEFHGRGSGHGVGLCVYGSVALAERGKTADQILEKYFPGLKISRA